MQQQETTIVFRDLKLFPSLNKLLREHFAARDKRKTTLQWMIKEQTQNKHFGPVRIRFIRHACQLQDWDNHCASFKDIGDALVKCKVITDDSPKVVKDFHPEQEKVSKRENEKIVIKITNTL